MDWHRGDSRRDPGSFDIESRLRSLRLTESAVASRLVPVRVSKVLTFMHLYHELNHVLCACMPTRVLSAGKVI